MNGERAYELLRGVGLAIRAREDVGETDIVLMVRQALGTAPMSQAERARRYRHGESRSVTQKRDGASRNTVTNVTRKSDERHEASRKNVTVAPLGFPLASPSGSPDPDPKASVVAPKDLTGIPRETGATTTAPTRPRNHAEALTEPAAALAELCRRDALYAQLVEVHRMPWVLEPIRAWHEAGGDTRELRLESNDGEVRAMVELTARGYLKSDLVRCARHLRGTDRYRDKVLASCMTKAVVDIALGELAAVPARSSVFAALPRPMFSTGKVAAE